MTVKLLLAKIIGKEIGNMYAVCAVLAILQTFMNINGNFGPVVQGSILHCTLL